MKVGNNTLTNKVRVLDDLKHLIIVPLDQSHFKPVFGGIDIKDLRLCLPVEAVHVPALDLGKVNRFVKRTNDSVVTTELAIKPSG